MKKDVDLFSRLRLSAQVRRGDVAEVFRHETRPEPLSLSHKGKIRGGVKADLLKYIKPENPLDISDSSLRGTVFEGSVGANTRKPGNTNTFKEFAENAFFPTIKLESKRASRIDIVFDTYISIYL